ncbi:MAG: hypothetical protein Q9164_001100 [Protoblastenia rupestris]
MSEDLTNEIEAINSIYGENTLHKTNQEGIYTLSIPSHPVSIRLSLPLTYPHQMPGIVGVERTGADTRKGYGMHVLELALQILREVYTADSVCLFDLIQELETRLVHEGERRTEEEKISLLEQQQQQQREQERGGGGGGGGDEASQHVIQNVSARHDPPEPQPQPPSGYIPQWFLSQPVTEKKSTFLARACFVHAPTMVRIAISHLLETDKKVVKATHNITAYRIRDPVNKEVTYQDCDDDGETAAGSRLLHLLQIMDVWDVLVVVSRWYGGVKLGADRFRLINQVGKEAVMRGCWVKGWDGKR